MRNTDIISVKLQEALDFLYEQDAKLKPVLEYLTSIIKDKLSNEDMSAKEAFQMLIAIQEQYTNNILVVTKIKEIIDFRY